MWGWHGIAGRGGHSSFCWLHIVNGGPCSVWARSPGGAADGHGLSQTLGSQVSPSDTANLSHRSLITASPMFLSFLPSASQFIPHHLSQHILGSGLPAHRKQAKEVRGLIQGQPASWWQRQNSGRGLLVPFPLKCKPNAQMGGVRGVSDRTADLWTPTLHSSSRQVCVGEKGPRQ